tara:strand:- start:939 stop:1622 length:684 start_codon:yes stop_codon:yes gene_type:complete
MKIAIHQPEFMPWLGYFHKMKKADIYVILDNVQFKKRYFENRNYIRNSSNNTKEWITIPVVSKGKFNQNISDVKILYEGNWYKKLPNTFINRYGKNKVTISFNNLIEEFLSKNNNSLLELNLKIIHWFRQIFNIETPLFYLSDLNIKSEGSNLILDICKKLNATTYICGSSGKDYLNVKDFENKQIKIEWQNFIEPKYNNSGLSNLSSYDFVQNFGLECSNEFNKLI